MKTKPALKVLAVYVAGVVAARYVDFPVPLVLFVTIFPLFVAFVLWYLDKGQGNVKETCLALGLMLIGVARYELATGYLPANHISKFTSPNMVAAVSGVVANYPERRMNRINLVLEAREIFSQDQLQSTQGRILVTLRELPNPFQYGDEIVVRGKLLKPRDRRNPGEFDYREYLQAQDIHGTISVTNRFQIRKLSSGHGNWMFREVICPVKKYLNGFIETSLPEQEAALLTGLLVGERGEISPEIKEAFSKLGVIHILAVSGSNVGFVLIIFMGIFGLLRLPYWSRVLISLIGIIFYVYLTDLNPPVVRAAIMGGFILFGKLIERKTDDFNTLALAALLILIFSPLDLFQASFQLSFAAVASIIYLYPKLKAATFVRSLYEQLKEWAVLRYGFELLLVSTAAFLGTLPFTILYFNRVPNLSLPANLLVIPLAFCGLASGIAAAILNLLIPFLADIYAAAAWLFLHALIKLAEWAGAWPLAYFELYRFLFLHAILYCIGLLLVFNLNQPAARRWVWIYALVLVNVFIWSGSGNARNQLQVVFLDVGQGDAVLVTFPDDRHLLIDGGPRTLHSDAGKWVIAPYLKRAGIRKLDALVLSHADADHLGGFPYIMRHFKVGEVWENGQQKDTALSREYLALIDSLQIRRRILRAGDMIDDFAPANMFIVHPSGRFLNHSGQKLNEGSLSLKLSYGAIDFLFTGDVELEGEQHLSQFGHLLESEVLKVGHHGSQTSSSPILLESVRPQVAVISAGELNKFGHPHAAILERFHQHNAHVLRTDRDAAVILTTDGQELKRVKWK